jgi:hypothetical protein
MVSLLVARAIARSRRLSQPPGRWGWGERGEEILGAADPFPLGRGRGIRGGHRKKKQSPSSRRAAGAGAGRLSATPQRSRFSKPWLFFYLFRTRRVQGNENSRRSAPERDDRKKAKKRLLCAVDHSARASMKSAASCVN